MKSIAINGSKRESVGKRSTKALRDAGKVPCVLYGGHSGVIHFAAPEKDFNPLVYTSDVHTVKLDLDGQKVNAVLQDIQFHPVTDAILHMDFYQFDDEEPITMTLPIQSTGVAIGSKSGGIFRFNMRRIDLHGLIRDLPDFIEVDISDLKIGDNLYVSQIKSDKYEILHDEDEVICQVAAPRDLEALEADLEEEEVPAEQGGEGEEAAGAGAEAQEEN